MEKPLKITKYLENINDIILSAIAPINAPITWLLNVFLFLGINLYSSKNTINVVKIKVISVTIDNIIL